MILVTGGLGFIGLNTARALLELGETCVLTRHRVDRQPNFIKDEVGRRIFIEQLDVTDLAALLGIGKRYPISGIIHLAGPGIGALDLFSNLQVSFQGLLNTLQTASLLGIRRVSVASAIGVYLGVEENPFREDMPLPVTAVHPIQTVKKCSELIASFVGGQAGMEVINLRIGAIWGPLGRPDSPFFITPRLVHAAVKGEAVDFSTAPLIAYSEDGLDMCYVKDCGRAIALLQLAPKLNHGIYNIGTGKATKNREVVRAIKQVIPDAKMTLAQGHDPAGTGGDIFLDITRLQTDTGFQPAYDIDRAIADYTGWLKAGNER